MKKLILFALLLFGGSAVIQAQEGMEEAMALMQPGPEHELLKEFVGSWDMQVKIWQAPGQDPMTTTGTCENRMILGDRFLITETVSGEGQMHTETMGIMGYDRRHKKFTNVGFDTWGTYYVTASGDYDEEKRQYTLYGEDTDPVMGIDQKYNFIITWITDDAWKVEVVFLDFPMVEEKEFKMVEITYVRP